MTEHSDISLAIVLTKTVGAEPKAVQEEDTVELEILRQVRGRVVLVEPGGRVHMGRGYEILSSEDEGRSWSKVTALPRSPVRWLVEQSRLASRLLRHEVRTLARLSDASYVAANRQGVFHGRAGDPVLEASQIEVGDAPLQAPLRIGVGPDDVVVWGEYIGRFDGRAIRIFASHDLGRSHQLVHCFAPGEVDHVHNVIYDAARGHYWVLTGDLNDAAGIGILDGDLKRFEWLRRGNQAYRAVDMFDFGDHFIYANDTQLETNGLICLDKETGEVERLRDFEGSCIDSCRFGRIHALTTSVEPSTVNLSQWATLWLSTDGRRWKQAYRGVKDHWNAKYLQFGSLVLPVGSSDSDTLYFSGQALEGIDDQTLVARIAPGQSL